MQTLDPPSVIYVVEHLEQALDEITLHVEGHRRTKILQQLTELGRLVANYFASDDEERKQDSLNYRILPLIEKVKFLWENTDNE